jgi:2-hydroxychromene-2-carboxylate isomerase
MWGKTKAPERAILQALFFDDQGVGQGGQLCQVKNTLGFNGFWRGGFRKLDSLDSAKESSAPRS